MKKILIIQTAFLGDVILATPVLEGLHNIYPEANIDFLLRKGNESLFKDHPFINEVIVWDKKQHKLKNLINIIKKIRANHYDEVINVHRFLSSGFITIFSGAAQTIGFDKNPFSFLFKKTVKHIISKNEPFIHETQRNISLIIDEKAENIKAKIKLYPSQQDFEKTLSLKTNDYICIAPSSVWFTKQYPVEKWVEFIDQVSSETKIYLLGSKDDTGVCTKIIQKSSNNNITDLSGKLSLLETAALMQDAKMNFVNDSAPLHLASSVNATVTAIFCSTIPAFGFGPLSENSAVIETMEKLDCRPCGLHGKKSSPEGHFKCAMTIDKEQLLKRIH